MATSASAPHSPAADGGARRHVREIHHVAQQPGDDRGAHRADHGALQECLAELRHAVKSEQPFESGHRTQAPEVRHQRLAAEIPASQCHRRQQHESDQRAEHRQDAGEPHHARRAEPVDQALRIAQGLRVDRQAAAHQLRHARRQ